MSKNPFRYFKTSPEVIQRAVMMYVRFPLSLRNVEDLLHEHGICSTHYSSVYNHFNFERHLYSRMNFKKNRDAALLAWCDLLVA